MNAITISHSEELRSKSIELIRMIQFASVGGFQKKYAPLMTTKEQKQEFLQAVEMMICDFSEEQINRGILRVRDCGYCPDLSLVRRWCMGLDGFDTPEDVTRKTYLGADSALAFILKYWKKEGDFITNAMQKAYEDTMPLFRDLEFSQNPDRMIHQVYKSFKQCYFYRVEEFVKLGIHQEVLEVLPKLGNKTKSIDDLKKYIVDRDGNPVYP